MKSYAVDSLYACIIVGAIFLMLPFFVPYEEDTAKAQAIGEYTIEDEEKPEVFTRIIDRVSSFYGFKRRKKNSAANASVDKIFTEHGKLASSKTAEIKNSNSKSNSKGTSAKGSDYASGESSSLASSRQTAQRSNKTFVEYKGGVYEVTPDAYGNKYLITNKGPVALKKALSDGGRFVEPTYNYGRPGQAGASQGYYSSASGSYYGRSANRQQANYKQDYEAVKVASSSSNKGRLGGFSSGAPSASSVGYDGVASKSSPRGGGLSSGNYQFDMPESMRQIKNNISGGGSSPDNNDSKEENSSTPAKTYSLQDKTPFIGNDSVGVASVKISTEAEDANFKEVGNGWGDWESKSDGSWSDFSMDSGFSDSPFEDNDTKKGVEKEPVTLNLSVGYQQSKGIIMAKEDARQKMTNALLNGETFIGKDGKENIPNPWILPNQVNNDPGMAFFKSNESVLRDINGGRVAWIESDNAYKQTKAEIANISKGSLIPLAMIDGQKDDNTMQTMPEDTYYYKAASSLLGDRAVNVDAGGGIDLNKIDKDNVLVVVPEQPLAENLKRDGFKVAVFNGYIVTPDNLKNFYGQTSSAVTDIIRTREENKEAKKKEIAASLTSLERGS